MSPTKEWLQDLWSQQENMFSTKLQNILKIFFVTLFQRLPPEINRKGILRNFKEEFNNG